MSNGMSSRFEAWVGSRYVRAGSGNSFVSLISAISMLGIAIAVAVLIIVLSVVNGFERELKERILTVMSHASIQGVDGALEDSEKLLQVAVENSRVDAAAPFVDGKALLIFGKNISGIEMRGIDPDGERRVSGIDSVMTEGALQDLTGGSFNIVLGLELANALQVAVGEKVTVTLAEGRVTPAGILPRTKRFTVSGIYRVGMFEFDRRLALVNILDAQKLFRMRDSVSGVRLAVSDVFDAAAIVREVALENGIPVMVSDWTRQHVNLFRSIQITKSILFVILLLLVAVAAFNIVSTLVMVVREKRADIAILRTVGAAPSSILKIFMIQGGIIGAVGTLAGVAFGLLVAINLESIVGFLESTLGIKFLAADVYFISDLPSDPHYGDVVTIAVIALVLALLSTIIPAVVAARTAPAEALRYD